MKIFMIADNMDIGGAETHIWELSRLLCARGHQITVLSGGGRLADRLSEIGVRHVRIPPLSRPASFPRALHRIAREIRLEKPHAVHAHTRRAAFACRLLLCEMAFPFVFTAHAIFRAVFPLDRLSFFPPSTVAVSEDIRRHLARHFGVPREHVTVIENGIDVSRFCPRAEQPRPFTVLHVSRLDRECAHTASLLIEAAPRLEAILGRPVRIVIVGDGSALSALRDKVGRLGKHQRTVSLLGARTDIPRLLNECDLFVGVSRAALEAMSSAKPVILSGNEGYLGVLDGRSLAAARESNFCARGHETADTNRLLGDILRLAREDARQRAALGTFGRAVVCQEYSAEEMARKTEAVYRAELDRFRTTRRQDALLCGYYGYGNCGDELILRHILARQHALSPNLRIAVMTADGRDRDGVHGLRRYDLLTVAREMKKSGAFILGGGSLLQDATSRRSLAYYLSLLALARHMAIPTMLYANGLGPLSPASLALCRRLLPSADIISLRDQRSYETVRAMGLPHTQVVLGADPVLGECPPPNQKRSPIVAFFPRGGSDEHQQAALTDAVGETAAALGLGVVVIPMNPREDNAAAIDACRRLRRRWRLEVSLGSSSPSAVEMQIGRAFLTVSERLHALILAFHSDTAAVGVARDPKITSFLCDLQRAPCVLPPSRVSPKTLLRAARYATEHPYSPGLRAVLRARALRDAAIANRLMLRE